MKKLLLATCVAVLTFVVVLPANQAVVRRFGFDDFSKVKRVSDPQFSPDGSALVYVVSTPNLDENRHMASLHRMAVAGGTAQLLVDGTKYVSVSFPDGRQRSSHRVSLDRACSRPARVADLRRSQ